VSLVLRPGNRLFVGLDPPPDARAALAAVGREVAGRLGGRAVPAESLHATIDFLGRVPPEAGAPLAEAVREALAGPAIPTGLGAVRARPAAGRARLVAVELLDPEGALAARAARVRAAVDGVLGRAPDGRALWPHVTVARWSRPVRASRLSGVDQEHLFDISRAALYDSEQSPGGPPRYRELVAVELVPAP
jgi:2'-5' RNA ligase